MKNTQWKWTYDTASGCIHEDGKLIAEVAGAGGSNYSHARGEANARLIAAAPEMYELVMQFAFGSCDDCMRILDESRKVLDRIDGKEKENDNEQ